MRVKDLLEDLKVAEANGEENIAVVIDDDAENVGDLEVGSVLDIVEAGGYTPGVGRTIRVKPR